MSASETLLMLERLKEARDLLEFLPLIQAETMNDSDISEAELMERLLVDYWHHIGRDRYLSRH
jgi:hypothetical protein